MAAAAAAPGQAAPAAPVQVLALPIPDAEVEELILTMDSEFAFLLHEYGLHLQIHARLVQCGFADMVTFAKVDRTEDGLPGLHRQRGSSPLRCS